MENRFYEFSQNNSGGSFVTDSKLCHRLFIEAKNEEEAIEIAESLVCYWNGVNEGLDCPCCGDRWYNSPDEIKILEMNERWGGYEINHWLNEKELKNPDEALRKLKERYKGFVWSKEPELFSKYGKNNIISGKVRIDNIEQYAKVLADSYGWTKPDCRIFYKDGRVKEIYSAKVK